MIRRLRDETGSSLIAAVLIVFIMMGFGAAVLAATDTQSQTSARERTREGGFNLAEAAMNAQALQMTRTWPSNAMPSYCGPGIANAACPDPNAVGGGYTQGDYGTACASSPTTPAWQTMVRDNASGEQYWTQSIASRAAYDANADGVVWLHSQATTRCHTVAMVSQVTQNTTPLNFPQNVVTANWIATSNQGRKVIVDTLGSGNQPAPIVVRCSGLTQAQCLNYQAAKGQVQPPAVRSDSNGSSATLTDSQLASLEQQAAAAGTLFSTTCPTTAAQLVAKNGAPVYVKGLCHVSVTGNTQINSAAQPGALIIEKGTLTLGGTLTFYGMIYAANKQGATSSVVTIQGNAQVIGAITIDGLGGLTAGSSKTNLINDPRASKLFKLTSGAKLNKNTFRVVPTS
jgi:Tfp pilus assembly protein PilX